VARGEWRYRADFWKPAGGCAMRILRRPVSSAETASRPPPHARARPSASPAGLGRLLRSVGKLGKLPVRERALPRRSRKPARSGIAIRRLAQSPIPYLRASSRTEGGLCANPSGFQTSPDAEARFAGHGSPTENCLREVFPLLRQTSLGLSKISIPPERRVSQSAGDGQGPCAGERRNMKLASMWRGARRSRAQRAPAVSLLRRGSAKTTTRTIFVVF
jgi:hypothetical protein